jgi:hypothetical protein
LVIGTWYLANARDENDKPNTKYQEPNTKVVTATVFMDVGLATHPQ